MRGALLAVVVACAVIVAALGANTDTPSYTDDSYCWISVSNGTEYCYYYSTLGYQCDPIGNASDPSTRNMTECSLKGVCYANMAGNTEVCYYLQPFGYQCYFKYEAKIVANMTHCDYLKSNLPPTIDINPTAGDTETPEDTVLPIDWVIIDDPDSRNSEPEDGYLQMTFTATKGKVGFDPTYIVDPVARAAAVVVLDQSSPLGDRATFSVGNGTLAVQLMFLIRATPLQALMKALIFLPDLNWNSAKGTSKITFFADDRGNSGGIPEQAESAVTITAKAVNDAPVCTITGALLTDEDTVLPLSTISVSDVDATEPGGTGILDVTITVLHGTLSITGTGLTLACTKPPPQLCQEFFNNKRQLQVRSKQTDIMTNVLGGQLKYTPDLNYNGLDTLTVLINDLGNTGQGGAKTTTKTRQITINAVNDAPTVAHPSMLYAIEDTPLVGLNATVGDVDNTDGLSVKITVVHGVLTCPGYATSATTFTVSNVTLVDIQHIFDTTTYTPGQDFNGLDTLTIAVDDIIANGVVAGLKTTVNIPLSVLAYNDPPVLHIACTTASLCTNAGEAAYTGTLTTASSVGQTITFASPGADTAPFVWMTDVDVGAGEMQIFVHVGYGTITIPPAALANIRVAYPLHGAGPFTTVMFFGTLAHVNAALDGMTYTRTSSGADELTLLISDQGNTGLGLTGTDYLTIAMS